MSVQLPASPFVPAEQTQLSQQGRGFLPIYISPNQGLVLRSSLWNLPQTAAAALNNLRWDGIRWTTQNIGWLQHRTGLFNSGAAFLEMGVHWTSSNASQFIQQVGNQVQLYTPLVADPGSNLEQVIYTASSATAIPCMRSYSPNFFLYVNGVNEPQYWNGSGWAALPGWPQTWGSVTFQNPSLVEVFSNRAAFAGFAGQPNAVIISNFGDPTTYTQTGTSGTIAVLLYVPTQLGTITSLKSMLINQQSNQQVLIIGCTKGLAFVNGVDATSFTTVAVTDRFGIPSNRIWHQIDNTIFALCTDGIRSFNANTTFQNLIAGALSFPIHPLITSMSTNQSLLAQAFVLDNPGQLEATYYYCSNSSSDTHNRTSIIMNYGNIYSGSAMFSQKVFPAERSGVPSSIMSPSCGIAYGGQYWAGGFNGILQNLYNNNTWNGTGINWSYLSPLIQPSTPAQESSMRGVWIQWDGLPASFTATAYAWMAQSRDENIRQVQVTSQNKTTYPAGTTTLGSWILGVSAWGGSQIQSIPFYPGGAGRSWQFQLSGNTLNGDANFVGLYAVQIVGGTRQ